MVAEREPQSDCFVFDLAKILLGPELSERNEESVLDFVRDTNAGVDYLGLQHILVF